MTLRLLSYNIRFGGRGREQALAETIVAAAPDLVVFQEATDPRVIERIAEATKYPFWAARRNHSIGFLSRREVTYHEWHYPVDARHSFLEIIPAGSDARVFGLHLSARFSKWDERRRAREIQSLLEGIKRHQNGFHVLVGDFNTLAPGEALNVHQMPAWIRALIWISGRKLQRETIQLMLDAGYSDGYRMLHERQGIHVSYLGSACAAGLPLRAEEFANRLVSCQVITEPNERIQAASDHCPLVAELEIGPQ